MRKSVVFKMAARNVSFTKPKTPLFIENFKKKVGYKETATVETKFEEADSSNLDDTELSDEKPTIILGSNVSETEAEEFLASLKEHEEAENKGLKLVTFCFRLPQDSDPMTAIIQRKTICHASYSCAGTF